ncbi:hypothetical protein [Rummeliibacillus suwonensis]|uniref:hypothetical protein n=1 Tax=Rummeliibacillus suwonensis TaxID=1306154 RepID=UPI0016493339|nr:hypothetical protein [Rummeliibacillus suwonensis]
MEHDYEYLQNILSNHDIDRLNIAVKVGSPIIVEGPQDLTRKSAFVKYLRSHGVLL